MDEQNNMSKHIDKSVIFFFVAVFLVSASLLGYKYYKNIPCKEVIFTFKADEFRQGELINFFDESEGAKIWNWKFGDSTEMETLKDPIHMYKKPGEYKVRLLVNNTCEKVITINIKEKKDLLDPNKIPQFTLPKSIVVGEKLKVKGEFKNDAATWAWRFGETASVNSKKRFAIYQYKKPGINTVSLVVNGDMRHIKEQRIHVLPKPKEEVIIKKIKSDPKRPVVIKSDPIEIIKDEPKEKTKKIIPYISEEDFRAKVLLVSRGKVKPNYFSEYLCDNMNIPIVVNGKSTTFLIFCQKIHNKKIKIKSKNFSLYRDKGSNCIKSITIKYSSNGIWRILKK